MSRQKIYCLRRKVKPHVPDAWMDLGKDKVGYEINFTKKKVPGKKYPVSIAIRGIFLYHMNLRSY